MSYDFDVRLTACDHKQSFERYVIDAYDFRTLHLAANTSLNMRAPINGQAQVKLYISGKLVQQNDITYGYDIVLDTNRIQTKDIFYRIAFRKPVRWYIPLIEVSYITLKPYCLKCSGRGTLNDFKKATSGSLLHVLGTDKLGQRVLKFVLTSRCPYYPKFTCKIKDYIGKKFGVTITETDVSTQILNSLNNLKQIQSAQRAYQKLDPQEMLKDVTNIVTSMPDPTALSVLANVSCYGNAASIPVNFKITSTKNLVGH